MAEYVPLFSAIIAFCAFFALLSGIIKMFLLPIEKDMHSLKKGQKELNKKLDKNDEIIRVCTDEIKKSVKEFVNSQGR